MENSFIDSQSIFSTEIISETLSGVIPLSSISSQTSTQFLRSKGSSIKKFIAEVTYPINGISPTILREAIM